MTTPGWEPDIQCSNDAVDQSSQNTMVAILRGLNDTLEQLTKASEKQTAMLTSLKDNILLRPESDEEAEKEDSNTSNTQLNITATLNNVLDPSDSCVVKESVGSDSEKQNDVLESLTQAFVQTNDKSPAITEKVASLIDNMASGGLSPETVKERVDKYPTPEKLTRRFGICFPGGAEQLTLLFRRCNNCLFRVYLPCRFWGTSW